MRALIVGLGSIGRRHARNWAALGLGPLAVCHQVRKPGPAALQRPDLGAAARPGPDSGPSQWSLEGIEAHEYMRSGPDSQRSHEGIEAHEYTDLDQALDRERPDIVLVTNPTSLHVETACRAVQAGAHVLVEKPLSHTTAGIQALLDAAHATKRNVMVGYNLRVHPQLRRLKELLDQQAIGKIVSARAEVGEYLPDWHPWEDYRQSYSGRRDLGGGAVLTFSHELDALCWLLGAPRRLTAMAAHASSLEIDTEDVAEIVLQFRGGAVGSVHVDYVRRDPRRAVELVGEQGVLRWDNGHNRIEQYSAKTGQWRIEEGDPRFERNQMFVDELRHFVKCVRGEIAPPLVDGEQGAAIVALAVAALQAARDGRTRDLDDEATTTRTWLSALNGPTR